MDSIKGEYDRSGYNKEGYDRDGYNKDGWNRDGWNKQTRNHFDRRGYYRDGFDVNGYDRDGYNADGYNIGGYDADGYDIGGYDRDGYDKDGWDRDGWDRDALNKHTKTHFDMYGYNINGYDIGGYDRDGYDKDGWDRDGYDNKGWNNIGLNRHTKNHFDTKGYDNGGYDKKGWDKNRLNIHTKTHFDTKGCDITGYDKDGFDAEGYDKKGWNKKRLNRHTKTHFDTKGYDNTGYDKNGYDNEGYDKKGWNESKLNKQTRTHFDNKGYDITGYDKNGYDRNKLNINGYTKSEVKYIEKLKNFSTKPLMKQIALFNTLDNLIATYNKYDIHNNKILQIESINKRNIILTKQNKKESDRLHYNLERGFLPDAEKLKQYELRTNNRTYKNPIEALRIWFYTASEWVVEDWAKKHDLDVKDYNLENQYSPSDYNISGIDVDVKTTVGLGNRVLPAYYSASRKTNPSEVIIGVKSYQKKEEDIIPFGETYDTGISEHFIQGVFDIAAYKNINYKPSYLGLDKKLINPCYFSPLSHYFKVADNIQYDEVKLGKQVIGYHLHNKILLNTIFFLLSKYRTSARWALEIVIPGCHKDIIPLVVELYSKDAIHLFPHYLADYLMDKIVRKQEIDIDTVNNVLYSIYVLNEDAKLYIDNLLLVSRVLPNVRCKFHPDETIKDMDIEYHEGSKPTFTVRCSRNPKLRSTIMTYSWKTGETLIYGGEGIEVCDDPRCGCLTHTYTNELSGENTKIGKRSCPKYGDPEFIPN